MTYFLNHYSFVLFFLHSINCHYSATCNKINYFQGSAKLEKAEILQMTVDHLRIMCSKGNYFRSVILKRYTIYHLKNLSFWNSRVIYKKRLQFQYCRRTKTFLVATTTDFLTPTYSTKNFIKKIKKKLLCYKAWITCSLVLSHSGT